MSNEQNMTPKTDEQLIYAAYARCPCGAGLAYPEKPAPDDRSWDCADILTGRAVPAGQPGSKQHTDRLPFAFYEVKSEQQPSAGGATTRPSGIARQFPPPPPEREPGQIGYEAYAKSLGGASSIGRPLVAWSLLAPEIAKAWNDAAAAIAAES